MKFAYGIFSLLCFLAMKSHAQEIHIGVEPFPPIISEDGTGYAMDMFKAIETVSDLKFRFHVMNYARAKKELKNSSIDIIGLTPKGYETEEFYQYAEDLHWSIPAKVDLFCLNTKFFNVKGLAEQSIGTLRGNADFFSELLGIPREKFIEVSSLAQLVQMLERKRLNVITFERAATMTSLIKFNVANVYYQNVAEIPASFAVQNNESGHRLKKTIDTLLKQVNSNYYFTSYFHYQNLPDSGKVITKNRAK
jgi:polar amino acid transport system substrate-binding protein